jgi:hypothetical protein
MNIICEKVINPIENIVRVTFERKEKWMLCFVWVDRNAFFVGVLGVWFKWYSTCLRSEGPWIVRSFFFFFYKRGAFWEEFDKSWGVIIETCGCMVADHWSRQMWSASLEVEFYLLCFTYRRPVSPEGSEEGNQID